MSGQTAVKDLPTLADALPAISFNSHGKPEVRIYPVASALGELLVAGTNRPRSRLLRRAARLALRGVRGLGDPSIRYQIGARTLSIPLSHDLPLHRAAHPQYSSNLSRVVAQLTPGSSDFTAIDVGANVGDSVALMRSVGDFPILCIEPEHSYVRYLHKNARELGNIDVLQAALGDRNSRNSVGLVSKSGTASVDPAVRGPIAVTTLDDVIEAMPGYACARLLKIDTDGSDLKVIRGSTSFLSAAQPILFFEYDPTFFSWEEAAETIELLRRLGYGTMLFWDNTGDFLIRLTTGDREGLRDLTSYYRGRASTRYCDVAVFAGADEAISAIIHRIELALAEERHCRAELGAASS
jgi:FkbM family methyltransferase